MKRVTMGGLCFGAGSVDDAGAEIEGWISKGMRGYVCLANVHVYETAQRDPGLLAALEGADLLLPDGAPLSWLLRRRSTTTAHRVAGSDLFNWLCSTEGLRHYFYGGTEHALARLTSSVRRQFPDIIIAGSFAPPFRPLDHLEAEDVVKLISSVSPDVVWVGLGAPKQELWMRQFRPRLDAAALIGVGAVFDFFSGRRRRAPLWMQQTGLEWLHRLVAEPRRLAGRYLRTNLTFLIFSLPKLLIGVRPTETD